MNIFMGRPKEYSTFIPLLLDVLGATDGLVLELGGGAFSTPLIHWVCHDMGRKCVTYEHDHDYYWALRRFRNKNHSVVEVSNWADMKYPKANVAFVDHDGKRRGESVMKLKDTTDYIVIHDSDKEKNYGYDKVFGDFKYRADWTDYKPWTTVLSNKGGI